MIDTHTHLQDSRFDEDRPWVVKRAREVGVTDMILPATEADGHQALLAVLSEYSDCCHGAMGVHPTTVNDNPDYEQELQLVAQMLESGRVGSGYRWLAVGEVGLDLYWSRDFLDQQIQALSFQLDLAVEYDLPVILHVRDAWDEIFEVLAPYRGRVRGVFHSFSGTLEHWQRIQAFGDFLVGIGGPITYKKSVLPDVLAHIPIQAIVLETDAPYLPPVPYRGQRNESAYVPIIAQKIAEIKSLTVPEVDRVTSENARKLFF